MLVLESSTKFTDDDSDSVLVTANTPGIAAFTATNTVTYVKKAVSSAVMIGMGGLGGIVAGLAYRQVDYPEYR